jgi:hypothetical protein
MKDQLAERGADLGAAVSTVGIATYSFTNFLEDTALVVAIISGSLAAAWHIYKFYQEYRGKKDARKSNEKQ